MNNQSKTIRNANDANEYTGIIVGLLGLVVGLVSIYFTVFDKDKPEFKYEIISSNNFINNKETASFLRILLNDTLDVQKNHFNISIYNIKVLNNGSSHIKYSDYDEGDFGLKIKDGTILESANVSEASTEHLKGLLLKNDCLNDSTIKDSTFINIPRLSLDKGDYYILHIVLLHNEDSIPIFIPKGKIIGQKNIEIAINKEQLNTPNYLFDTFKGDWIMQIIRLIAYAGLFFLIIYIMVQINDKYDDIKRRRKRILIENSLNMLRGKMSNDNFFKIISDISNDTIDNQDLNLFEEEEEELSRRYEISVKNFEEACHQKDYSRISDYYYLNKISKLIDNGYFALTNKNTIQINNELKVCVKAVFDFLNENNISWWDFYVFTKHYKRLLN